MIKIGTIIKISDNTGAREAKVIGIPGGSHKLCCSLGDLVIVSVTKAIPHGLVSEHTVNPAVITRVKKEYRRADGSYVRFDENAGVILSAKTSKEPKGTRVFGPIARELKERGYDKIISLALEVV
ncbi:50S ribosomal protein L14 [Candidatus Dojkabacteria bacterium]|nr:50S ribosomal protein L14 [Candidatus Dojkabacteria bacterium]